MMKKRTAALALTAAFGVYSCKDTELTAPTMPKSGRHAVLACSDTENKATHVFSTVDTVDVWRPFGRNTREFTDIITQEKKAILETDYDKMHCTKITPAAISAMKL